MTGTIKQLYLHLLKKKIRENKVKKTEMSKIIGETFGKKGCR